MPDEVLLSHRVLARRHDHRYRRCGRDSSGCGTPRPYHNDVHSNTALAIRSPSRPTAARSRRHIKMATWSSGMSVAAGSSGCSRDTATWSARLCSRPTAASVATAGKDQTVKLWSLATRRQTAQATFKGDLTPVWSVAYSPDGKTLAVADGPPDTPGTVTLWDLATRKVKATLDGHERGVATVVFSPDGKLLASGGWDGTIRIWDAQTGEPRHVLTGSERRVPSWRSRPTARLLASAGEGNVVTLWDVATGSEESRLTGFRWPVQCVAFSPDGTAAGDRRRHPRQPPGAEGEVKFWDVTSRIRGEDARRPHAGRPGGRFSPDGAWPGHRRTR